jgi:hypothetical protein
MAPSHTVSFFLGFPTLTLKTPERVEATNNQKRVGIEGRVVKHPGKKE